MAKQETQLKAVLTLVDRVSPALKGMKKELRVASREFRQSISQIGDIAKTAGAALATMAAAGGTAWAATVAAADATVALDSFSKQIGINIERLRAWQNVAVSSGMEAEEFSEALRDMNIELSDAATGGKDELAQLLNRVGISARDSSGNIRNANDVFLEFADAIARQTDPMIQYRMAILAFGEDTGAKILPVLRQGSAAFRESEEAMRAAGSAITDKQVSRLKDFRNQWGLVKQSFSALSVSVLSGLAPSLSKLAQGFQKTLNEARPLINAHIERWSEQLSQAMEKIPWDKVIRKIDALISGGEKLKQEFGYVGEALSFVFENIGTIASVYLGSKALMAVVSFGQALVNLGKGIQIFLKVALPLVSAASPLVLLGTILTGAAMGIITNWEKIRDVVVPIIKGLGSLVQWLMDLFTAPARWLGEKIGVAIEALTPDFLKKDTSLRIAFDRATQIQPEIEEQIQVVRRSAPVITNEKEVVSQSASAISRDKSPEKVVTEVSSTLEAVKTSRSFVDDLNRAPNRIQEMQPDTSIEESNRVQDRVQTQVQDWTQVKDQGLLPATDLTERSWLERRSIRDGIQDSKFVDASQKSKEPESDFYSLEQPQKGDRSKSEGSLSTDEIALPIAKEVKSMLPSVFENKVDGVVSVVFKNAPQGLSIEKSEGKGGVDVDAKVNYGNTGRGPYAPVFSFVGGEA